VRHGKALLSLRFSRAIEIIPQNDRYDLSRQISENVQQEVLQSLECFVIGAGALDCEQQKTWL
jgi:hypothetical protein